MDFKNFLHEQEMNECVVAAVRLKDHIYLAKNRDRGYKAKVEVHHELINGVEIMVWFDTDTDWSEGMNEYGIGLVNSSLLVVKDEKEAKEAKNGVKKKKMTTDGLKIRKALSHKNLQDVIDTLLGKNNGGKAVSGQTIVSDGKDVYVLEIPKKYPPTVTKVPQDSLVTVRTNHGLHHKKVGYITGKKKESSHSRLRLAQENLEKAKNPKNILDLLRKKSSDDPFLNPYRTRTDFNMQTTGQILLDLTHKTVTIRMDRKEGQYMGLKNKLPDSHKPKIKLHVI